MSETEIHEPWECTLYIPNDLRAVTVSRRTLRLILTIHGLIRLADVAELLATELVSNAVRHTKGPAALRVRWSAGVLRVGAWARTPGRPSPQGCWSRPSTWRRGEGWRWSGPVRMCGAGSR
ncbi:hypothetical protein GCM10027072_14800 [Streptomyces bullii]